MGKVQKSDLKTWEKYKHQTYKHGKSTNVRLTNIGKVQTSDWYINKEKGFHFPRINFDQ